MNSPKKFRVWDVTAKLWRNFLYVDVVTGNVSGNDKTEYIIEQFTGLKDNHGVDIYEGDFVQKYVIHENHLGEKIANTNNLPQYEVKWQQQHCGFGIAVGARHFYVVTGNIHEKK